MSDETRISALRNHPLVRRSMNEHLGEFGRVIDISIEPGWLDIFEKLFQELACLPEQPRIVQTKEKFGELTVYLRGPENPAARALIERAAGEAARTCQICGQRGRRRDIRRWVSILCDGHEACVTCRVPSAWHLPGATATSCLPTSWLRAEAFRSGGGFLCNCSTRIGPRAGGS